MENKIDLEKDVSYSFLKYLTYDGCTPLHFLKLWQKHKELASTPAGFRGNYRHAATLQPKLFEKEYYFEPEISLEELNTFRFEVLKLDAVKTVNANCKGFTDLLEEKKALLGITPKMKMLPTEAKESIEELRENLQNDPEISALINCNGNIVEQKMNVKIEGVSINFICDIYNPEIGFEIDQKDISDTFISSFIEQKKMGSEILQRGFYNIFLRELGINIKENYLIIIDALNIPKLVRYDREEIKDAERKAKSVIQYFKQLKETGFHGYQYEKNNGKICPTYILPNQIEALQKPVGNVKYEPPVINTEELNSFNESLFN